MNNVVFSLMEKLKSYDEESYEHSKRVGMLFLKVFPNSKDWEFQSALLHDCGKIFIPKKILCKPGSLSKKERIIMNLHSSLGALLLFSHGKTKEAKIVCNHHVVKDDLVASKISFCDVFDALTSKRCYKEPIEKNKALKIMREEISIGKLGISAQDFEAWSEKL